MTIYVVPFDFCNLGSIQSCLARCSISYEFLSCSSALTAVDKVILPGVGTFEQGMNYLRGEKLDKILINHSLSGGFLLGICLGMQLMFESSEENPGIHGLSVVPGTVKKLSINQIKRVPHMGWSALDINPRSHCLNNVTFANLARNLQSSDFYFVHSFYCAPSSSESVLATVQCGEADTNITAMICRKKSFGCQFHPEKSGPAGQSLLSGLLTSIT